MNNPETSKPGTAAHTFEELVTAGERADAGSSISKQRLIGSGIVVILLLGVFGKSLFDLAVHVANAELHSHVLLVPFISAYLLHIRWHELPKRFSSSPFLAAIAFALGAAAWWMARTAAFRPPAVSQNDHLALLALAFVCCVVAAGFALLGGPWMRAAAFPVFFLLFVVPLPDGVVNALETASKLASAEATMVLFTITGLPFLRDGLVFQLPGITIEVAQECSGIRSSWVLVITSLLAANLFLRTTWRRTVLVLFIIPLGVIRNGFRIWTIALLCVEIGPEMIHSILHRRGGPVFFALSLIPLFGLLWWLRASEAKKERRDVGAIPATATI